MINEKVINKIKYYLLILFVVIQPILDIYYLYTDKVVNMIGFSPSTIIRVGITGILVLLTLITTRNKKNWIFIIIYGLIVGIYTCAHLIHANNFHSLVPGNFGYSITGELFYIARLMIPLCIAYIAYNMEISSDDFEKAIKIILIMIAGTIVVTNLFKISLNSYTNEVIKDNIFGWFMGAYDKYNYSSLASKGIFNFANQIAALLVLLLPVMMAIYVQRSTILNLATIIITILAMVMLGTKVALFGAIIDVLIFACILIFVRLVRKENTINKKTVIAVGLSIIVLGGLFMKAPAINREIVARYVRINNSKVEVQGVEEQPKEEVPQEQPKEEAPQEQPKEEVPQEQPNMSELQNEGMDQVKQPDKNNKDAMIEYIEKNYKNLMVGEQFITKSYPYQYDPEFWVDIINLPVVERLDWRNIEQRMLQRVMDINDNPTDKLLGLTFVRTQNIFNLERDFVSQYYSIGILGVIIFLGPYVLLALAGIIRMLMRLKDAATVLNLSSIFAIIFALGVSYYSGNVLDALTVTIILAFILGHVSRLIFIESNNCKDSLIHKN